MCTVSWVHDQFEPVFPDVVPWVPPKDVTFPIPTVINNTNVVDLKEFQKLIERFKELVSTAEKLDSHLNQPDCVDPEKVKLIERINELEKIIAQPPEFVIVHKGQLDPGTYRVIDGKLYKAL